VASSAVEYEAPRGPTNSFELVEPAAIRLAVEIFAAAIKNALQYRPLRIFEFCNAE
jgi:hypothetical protein